MRSVVMRTSSTVAALALLAALVFPAPAQQPSAQRPAPDRVQRPVEQEPAERLAAPQIRAEQIEVQELSERELAGRPELLKLPRECAGLKVVVDAHDVPDDFKPPGNPVTPSPELTAFAAAALGTKGYDDPTVNRWFVDSFRLRNCRVCHAVLQVRVRHYFKDSFGNDGLVAGLAPYSNPATNFVNVSLWSSNPSPQTRTDTYILPAGALSTYLATDNPLPTFLDLRVQDDTDVDYARLYVWYY